jgi:hypothetical protein
MNELEWMICRNSCVDTWNLPRTKETRVFGVAYTRVSSSSFKADNMSCGGAARSSGRTKAATLPTHEDGVWRPGTARDSSRWRKLVREEKGPAGRAAAGWAPARAAGRPVPPTPNRPAGSGKKSPLGPAGLASRPRPAILQEGTARQVARLRAEPAAAPPSPGRSGTFIDRRSRPATRGAEHAGQPGALL